MPQACFASLKSAICGGASLIGTLDCLHTKIKKVPIYTNFKAVMTFCDFIGLFSHPLGEG